MWPFYKPKTICTFILTPDTLICALVTQGKDPLPKITAFKSHPLHTYFYAENLIAHSTWLSKTLHDFIDENTTKRPEIRFALSGNPVKQTITYMHKTSPSFSDFTMPHLRSMLWGHTYLYPTLTNQFAFYVYGFMPQFLFQLKMICHKASFKKIEVTTTYSTLIQSYKALYGSAFRPSQLALDLSKNNDRLEYLFTPDATQRLIHAQTPHSQSEHLTLFSPLIAGLWHMPNKHPLILKL